MTIRLNVIYGSLSITIDTINAGDSCRHPIYHGRLTFLEQFVILGFFDEGMTQQINWDIIKVDIIGAHTMFLHHMFCTIF